MTLHINENIIDRVPETFLRAQMNYLRHYRELMRKQDTDELGNPCPHLWSWAIMIQPEDMLLVPTIEAGPAAAKPRWLSGHSLAIVTETDGDILAWAK